MPRTPSIAIVIEGGLVQVALVEDWPGQAPLPRIVIVDYDDDDTPEDELTSFNIGNEVVDARCHEEIPSVYESFTKPALSPRVVLRALGVADDDDAQSPLEIARRVRREILDLDAEKAQGDPVNFGE